MNIFSHVLLLCLLLLVHFHLVTAFYFALSNPWKWNWLSWYRGKNSTSTQLDLNGTIVSQSTTPIPNLSKTSEESLLFGNLVGAVTNIRMGKSSQPRIDMNEIEQMVTTTDASQTIEDIQDKVTEVTVSDLNFVTTSTVAPFESVSTEKNEILPTTTNYQPQTTEFNLNEISNSLLTTLPSLVESDLPGLKEITGSTTREYLNDFAITSGATLTSIENDITTTSATSKTTIIDPVVSLLIQGNIESVEIAPTTTAKTQNELLPTTTEQSIVSNHNQSEWESTETIASTTPESAFIELSTIATVTNLASGSVSATTASDQSADILPVTKETSNDEGTTPNEQFMRELIALRAKQSQIKIAPEVSTETTSEIITSTRTSRDWTQLSTVTSISVEVNTRPSEPQAPVFQYFTSTTERSLDDVTILNSETTSVSPIPTTTPIVEQRENRKLPFAFYENQPSNKPLDEGKFVSSFQDFYSNVDIFNGLEPGYNAKQVDNLSPMDIQSSWFVPNTNQIG